VTSLVDNVTATAAAASAASAAAAAAAPGGTAGAAAAQTAADREAAESVDKTLALFETIATSNPDALLRHGGAKTAVKLLRGGMGAASGVSSAAGGAGSSSAAAPTTGGSSNITLAAVRTLEKLNRVPGAGAALMEAGAVEAAVEVARRTARDDAGTAAAECSLRMLERMCRSEEQAEYLRSRCDGMLVLSTALEANKANDRVCKAGGKVLTRLAAGNVGDLVTRMTASGSVAETEFLSGLLSNLALEEESAEKIVSAGGVSALLKTLDLPSKRAVEASARAISRLATSGDAVDELVRAGAVDTLVSVLATNGDDAAVVASVTPTLTKLAACVEHTATLFTGGAVRTVTANLTTRGVADAGIAADSLAFLDSLLVADGDAAALTAAGVLPAITAALAAHATVPDIQLNGLRCLTMLAVDEEAVAAMMAAGVVPILYAALAADGRRDVVLTALYLVTSLSLVPAALGALKAPSFVNRVLPAVAAYASDAAAKDAAAELLAAVIGEEQVAATVADLSSALAVVMATRTKADATKLKDVAARLAALAAVGGFADMVLDAGGAAALLAALAAVTNKVGIPDAEGVLVAVGGALTALGTAAAADADLMADFLAAGVVPGIVASMKAAPKLTRHIAGAVRCLEACAAHKEAAGVIVEEGGVEACTAVLRAPTTGSEVMTGAVATLLALAASDVGAVAVARRGGARAGGGPRAPQAAPPHHNQPPEKGPAPAARGAGAGGGRGGSAGAGAGALR